MKNRNKAIEKIERAVKGIEDAIHQRRQDVLAVTTIEQLAKFRECFLHILKSISLGDIPEKNNRDLGISKVVVDQWPFDLDLGLFIVEAEQAYKNL